MAERALCLVHGFVTRMWVSRFRGLGDLECVLPRPCHAEGWTQAGRSIAKCSSLSLACFAFSLEPCFGRLFGIVHSYELVDPFLFFFTHSVGST